MLRPIPHGGVDAADQVVDAVRVVGLVTLRFVKRFGDGIQSAGTGVSSPDAMSTGATRGDFGDVGVPSSFP